MRAISWLARSRHEGCTSRINRQSFRARRSSKRSAMKPGNPVMKNVSLSGIGPPEYNSPPQPEQNIGTGPSADRKTPAPGLNETMYVHDDAETSRRYEANQLFQEAYEAQLANDYDRAIELYRRSLEMYPTAEAHTFLGWVYSFQQRYDEAIDECLEAIRVDDTLGNPYNDI